MKSRIQRILRSIAANEDSLFRLGKVEEFGENALDLEIYNDVEQDWLKNHRTFLRVDEFADGDKAIIHIEHLWGHLNTNLNKDDLIEQLLRALEKNTFDDYFIGLRKVDEQHFLSLNCSFHVLARWSDEDINELLHTTILNIVMTLGIKDTSLTAFENACEI